MPTPSDLFRDFGIDPTAVTAPTEEIRAYLPVGHVIGQFLATFLMSGLGLGMALGSVLMLGLEGLGLAALLVAGFGYVVYRATRYDYAWVELQGDNIRAKHLYTRRVVERSIDEVEDLLTLVFPVQNTTTAITDALVGRVRGILIRFTDQQKPLQVSRADPAMRNARELIEAIVYRMIEKGDVDVEVINLEGRPMVRRIARKS
jgi:hypothetical protein